MKQMKRSTYAKLYTSFIALGILCFHTGIFAFLWYKQYNPMLLIPYYRRGSYLIIFLFFCSLYLFNHIFGGLRVGYYKQLDCIVAQTLSLLPVYVVFYLLISLLAYRFVNPAYMLASIIIGLVFNTVWTILSSTVYYRFNPPRQMLLIYGDSPIAEVYDKITSRKEKYEIVKRIYYKAGEEKLKKEISKYQAVILHDLSAELRNHLIKYCYEYSIRVYVTPKIYDILVRGASDMDLFDTPFLLMRNRGLSPLQAGIKRTMDILISLFCILLASPIMLLVALLIKCFDHGPVFYTQTRLTIGGKEFQIIKFRSMRVDAEKDTIRLMSQHDNRITPLGKILRSTHLDELPQLFNILSGNMSLVGPRPERPEIARIYGREIPEFSYRLKVKAGLTGYAQVYGKYNSTPYDKLKLDLIYIQNCSILLDIKLLLLTGKTLFIPDHAEGVSSEFRTALRSETAAAKETEEKK